MPKLKDGRFRITPDGYHQVRYRRDGYDIQFTSKSLQTVKDKFREWVRSVNAERRALVPPKPKKSKNDTFGDFAERYFTAVKRANVEENTFQTQHRALHLHILPLIGFNGEKVLKCSREIKIGDELNILRGTVRFYVRVTGFVEKRVGAPVARTAYEQIRDPENLAPPPKKAFESRTTGSGRPTKRDRRAINRLKGKF